MSNNPLHAAAASVGAIIAQADSETGRVMISEDGGRSFQQAPAAVGAMLTDKQYIDPGQYDPLDSDTEWNEIVLESIIEYYRPDLQGHHNFRRALAGFVANAQTNTVFRMAMQSKSNYDRWDCLANNVINHLDHDP